MGCSSSIATVVHESQALSHGSLGSTVESNEEMSSREESETSQAFTTFQSTSTSSSPQSTDTKLPKSIITSNQGPPEDISKERKTLEMKIKSTNDSGEIDVARHIEEFRMREELNKDSLEKQKLRHELSLQEKLQRRKQNRKKTEISKADSEAKSGISSIADRSQTEVTKVIKPSINKDCLYSDGDNIALFSDLESHAISLKSSNITFKVLMTNLLIDDLSELEKVRILFHWITFQNLDAIDFPISLDEDSPLGYLKAIKDENKSYASLFQRLCNAAGLHAKTISGYVKAVGYEPGYKFSNQTDPLRGSWNAVLIDRQWRFVDTNWGARSIIEEEEKPRENWHLEYEYEEFYFLTDPENLINTHFPDEKEWQLLPQPITLDQFEDTIRQWPLYYKLNLSQNSHHSGVIAADQHGYVQIKLGVPPAVRPHATFSLKVFKKMENNSKLNPVKQNDLHYQKSNEEIFEIFAPAPGSYLLKMYGASHNFRKNKSSYICKFLIECTNIEPSPPTIYRPPFPAVDYCYGPTKPTNDLGLKARSHYGAVVDCDEKGEAKIVMSVPKSKPGLKFLQDLKDVDLTKLPDSTVRFLFANKMDDTELLLIVYIRVPCTGNFLLTLYACDQQEDANASYPAFCYYLVTCTQKSRNAEKSFPEVTNGALGKSEPHFSNLGIDVTSCSGGGDDEFWLQPDDKGESWYTFAHNQPLVTTAHLQSLTGKHDEFVTVITDGKSSTILIRTPPTIKNGETLALKVYCAPAGRSESLPFLFAALVAVKQPNQPCIAFPTSHNRSWGSVTDSFYTCKIISLKFNNSFPAVQPIYSSESDAIPFRIYKGGPDMEVVLDQKIPLKLKPVLAKIKDGKETQCDGFAFLSLASETKTKILLRFVEKGVYVLQLYGRSISDNSSDRLGFLCNALFEVVAASDCHLPFPKSYGIWSDSNVNLTQPLTSEIPRNQPVTFKMRVGRYQKTNTLVKVVPFYQVMLLTDGKTPQEPEVQGECEYEWKYFAGPAEKLVYVAVKDTKQSSSMSYMLEYKVTT